MHRVFAGLLCLCAIATAEEAGWMRYPAISPNGSQVAFSYKGDLWLVPATGGEARPLTSHVGYERSPVWSPDGKWIAFASDRHGNFDVFVVSSQGGKATRLTHHSAPDEPCCFNADSTQVLFSSRRLDAPDAAIGSAWMPELYSVAREGGRPRQELTTAALNARLSPDGSRIAYESLYGYENQWRKHHTAAVARDVWVWERETRRHTRLTPFKGEDRNPVWSADGKSVFYLSERGGSFNVWSRPVAGGEPTQVTKHGPHPVRFLSAGGGTLCYGYNGELWIKKADSDPVKLSVQVATDGRTNDVRVEVLRDGATEFAVAPNEEEVAFVLRGEIFVASVKHGTTKRITHTPQQERSLAWAPDGRTLYFATERGASWDIYAVTLQRAKETHFFNATTLARRPVVAGPDEEFQPVVSPDGYRIAYLHNRDEIRVYDLQAKKSTVLVPAARNYSYADGDIDYRWSPDGHWLAFSFLPEGRWIDEVGVVDAHGGAILNMTISGYDESRPRWSADGTALLFYSNRFGRRNHGSWGADGDVFALDLTQKAHDRARLTVEEFELTEVKDDEKGDGEGGDGPRKWRKKKKKKKKPAEPVRIEAEGREDRLRRLTVHSAPVNGYALSPDGETLVYFAQVKGKWKLWASYLRKSEAKQLMDVDGPGEIVYADDDNVVFLRTAKGRIMKVPVPGAKGGGRGGGGGGGGKPDAKAVAYAAEMTIDGPAERAYIFDHAWRQAKQKFYKPDLHGADWDALKKNYGALLGHIDNNHDFAELLSEMLGELNASHTGSGYRIPQKGADETAALGLLFDPTHEDDGLRVVEVLKRGPCAKADDGIVYGAVLTHIDGVALKADLNHYPLLNRKAGKPTLLKFRTPDGATFERVVKPIKPRAESNLRYRRWVIQRRTKTDELSKNRVGYVHVRGMNDGSFRTVFQEALGRYGNREALVVDTRFNGGGWLHDDLVKFLGGTQYGTFHPRGKKRGSMGGEPLHRWARPVVVIQSESNYSDAHIFPWAFKTLDVGKLIGTPVAGTGTAVWWETQIDPTLYFGIPQVGFVDAQGRYLENQELQPDVLVYNDANARQAGRDPQLEAAVAELLKQLDKK